MSNNEYNISNDGIKYEKNPLNQKLKDNIPNNSMYEMKNLNLLTFKKGKSYGNHEETYEYKKYDNQNYVGENQNLNNFQQNEYAKIENKNIECPYKINNEINSNVKEKKIPTQYTEINQKKFNQSN